MSILSTALRHRLVPWSGALYIMHTVTLSTFVPAQLLQAALFGLEHRKAEIERMLGEVRTALRGAASDTTETVQRAGQSKRSAEARARMAEAQRRRRATEKEDKTGSGRKMSAEGRARIAQAAREMWATKRAAAKKASA